jgi:hypothetical protein
MTDTSDTKKERMIEALGKSLGVVTTACQSVGISRDTHYRWLKEDPDYNSRVNELDNIALDFAESHLHMLIKDGSAAATIFYLKTKGKRRGYVERQEIEVQEKKGLSWFTDDNSTTT